jgi:hypothetical protein
MTETWLSIIEKNSIKRELLYSFFSIKYYRNFYQIYSYQVEMVKAYELIDNNKGVSMSPFVILSQVLLKHKVINIYNSLTLANLFLEYRV